MSTARALPQLELAAFSQALRRGVPVPLSDSVEQRLFAHYQTLRKWNPRLSLIGPGTVDEVVSRHYGESLAGSDWIEDGETVLDVGSGAGFPGLILALARPNVRLILVESRERKWSFLQAAMRAARPGLQATDNDPTRPFSSLVLNARIGRPLPAGIPSRLDVVTSRAVRLVPDILEPLIEHSRTVRFLLWHGEGSDLPALLRERKRRKLVGGARRHLIEAVVANASAAKREGSRLSNRASEAESSRHLASQRPT